MRVGPAGIEEPNGPGQSEKVESPCFFDLYFLLELSPTAMCCRIPPQ